MIHLPIEQVRPGDILAAPLWNPREPETILVERGAELGQRQLRLLAGAGVRGLWLEHPNSANVAPLEQPNLSEALREMIRDLPRLFHLVRAGEEVGEAFQALRPRLIRFIQQVRLTGGRWVPLMDVRLEPGDLGAFGGELAYLAVAIALELRDGLWGEGATNETKLQLLTALGMGALFHEIGLMGVGEELLDTPVWDWSDRQLTEYEGYPVKGYRLLCGSLGQTEALIALRHRLYADGSGFPTSVTISLATLDPNAPTERLPGIVALARAFLELVLRQDYIPLEALEELYCARRHHFDPQHLAALGAVVGAFQPGDLVRLTSGHAGVVVTNEPGYPFAPRVILHWDGAGRSLPREQQIVLRLAEVTKARVSHLLGRPVRHLLPESLLSDWEGWQ